MKLNLYFIFRISIRHMISSIRVKISSHDEEPAIQPLFAKVNLAVVHELIKTYALKKIQNVRTALITCNTSALYKCPKENPSGRELLLSPSQCEGLLERR